MSVEVFFLNLFFIFLQKKIRNAIFETGTNRPMIVIMMQLKRNHVIHCDAVIYPFCMAIAMVSDADLDQKFCDFSVILFHFVIPVTQNTSSSFFPCVFIFLI